MNRTFSVFFKVASPITLGYRLNFDAMIGNAIMQECEEQGIEETEAIRRANNEIPITRSHGVYAASSALIPRCPVLTYVITGSLERQLQAIPNIENMIQKNEKKRTGGRDFDKISKRYVPMLSRFTEYDVTADGHGVWFVAHGDMTKVERLLNVMMENGGRIGTKRRAKIIRFEIDEAPDTTIPGILHDGTILRPVPCEALKAAPRHCMVSEETICPPYWRGERHTCYVPPHDMWDWVGIKRLIGKRP